MSIKIKTGVWQQYINQRYEYVNHYVNQRQICVCQWETECQSDGMSIRLYVNQRKIIKESMPMRKIICQWDTECQWENSMSMKNI